MRSGGLLLFLVGGIVITLGLLAIQPTQAQFSQTIGGGLGAVLTTPSPSPSSPSDFGEFEVLGQLLGGSGQGNQSIDSYVSGTAPFTTIFNRLVQIVTGIAVLAGVGGVVAGGYLYMTAQGNGGQVEKGKEFIKNSLFAIALAVGAVLLLNTISPQFGDNIQEPVLTPPQGQFQGVTGGLGCAAAGTCPSTAP